MSLYDGLRELELGQIRRLGLLATSAATGVAAVGAIAAAVTAASGQAPSLTVPFLLSGSGLLLASAFTWFDIRRDIVEVVLGGVAAGSFGITLAEMSAQAMTIADHYKSLWIPMAIGTLLVVYLVFSRISGSPKSTN